MRTSKLALALSTALAAVSLGCSTGGPTPPKGGTPEWHWDNAQFYYDRGDFSKMVSELDIVAERDTPLNQRAVIWRTAVLLGLAQGYTEMGDAFRAALEKGEDVPPDYQHELQQVNREARQAAVDLAESLGQVDQAMSGEKMVCDFPFPSGSASEPALLSAIRKGDPLNAAQLKATLDLTVRRGIILAATEFCGVGVGPDSAAKAETLFEAGPVEVPRDEARFTLAKMLLDASVIFSRERLNEPAIRKVLIDRAEQRIKPYLESDNEELKKRAEEFAKEIEDERRDMRRKRRLLNKRK